MGGSSVLQELVLYAASTALSCLVLFAGLRHLDPNWKASKKALEHKKEIAKRWGHPLIQTNPYKDVIACDVINPDHIDVEFDSLKNLDVFTSVYHYLLCAFYLVLCSTIWLLLERLFFPKDRKTRLIAGGLHSFP